MYFTARGNNTANFSIIDSLGQHPIINITATDVEIYSDESFSKLKVGLVQQLQEFLLLITLEVKF